jgi:hypothetical protein
MTPFALERQPKNSQMLVVYPDTDTTVLVFSAVRLIFILCAIGLAGGVVLLIAWIVNSDARGWNAPFVGKLVTMTGVVVFLAIALLFGHYRLTVTPQAVAKSLRVFGMNLPLDRARFTEVTAIVCTTDKLGPVILLNRSRGVPLFLEGFNSPEERDWIAEGLRGLWQDAKRTPKQMVDDEGHAS